MKKSLIVLAVLGAFSSAASAQTSTTIYGLVDAGIVHERGGPTGNVTKLTSGVQNGSRLGFRGNEDLGGGLSAKFVLEAGFNIDAGTSGQGGVLFGRQAYVGLGSNWGSVLLGRQYTPLHTALDQIDPFGTGLAGNIENLFPGGPVGFPAGGPSGVRMNNTIKYVAPEWSGITGELAYGFGEAPGDNAANRQIGAAAGYANGPIIVKLVHHRAEDATGADDARNTMIGGKWDFGVAAAHAAFQKDDGLGLTDSREFMVGASAPVGAGKVLASFIRRDDRSALNRDARQWALGYTHALSKRTNFYTSLARITNKNGATFTVGNATEPGTSDKAFNVGVRHLF